MRGGWKFNTVKRGDKVSAVVSLLRNGDPDASQPYRVAGRPCAQQRWRSAGQEWRRRDEQTVSAVVARGDGAARRRRTDAIRAAEPHWRGHLWGGPGRRSRRRPPAGRWC